jgi:hypothetical protein
VGRLLSATRSRSVQMSLRHLAHLNSPSSPTRTSERTCETISGQSPAPCRAASGRPRRFSRAPQPKPCSYGRLSNAHRQASRLPSPLSERAESSRPHQTQMIWTAGTYASLFRWRKSSESSSQIPRSKQGSQKTSETSFTPASLDASAKNAIVPRPSLLSAEWSMSSETSLHKRLFSEPRQCCPGGSLNQQLAGSVLMGFSEPLDRSRAIRPIRPEKLASCLRN